MLVDEIAALFSIPDLCEALLDYIQHVNGADNGYIRMLGGCHYAIRGCQLPFTHLQVWNKFHLKDTAYHFPHNSLPSKTVNASPPFNEWILGQCDPVITNLDLNFKWLYSELRGMRLIAYILH